MQLDTIGGRRDHWLAWCVAMVVRMLLRRLATELVLVLLLLLLEEGIVDVHTAVGLGDLALALALLGQVHGHIAHHVIVLRRLTLRLSVHAVDPFVGHRGRNGMVGGVEGALRLSGRMAVEVGEIDAKLEEVGELISAGRRDERFVLHLILPRHGGVLIHGRHGVSLLERRNSREACLFFSFPFCVVQLIRLRFGFLPGRQRRVPQVAAAAR